MRCLEPIENIVLLPLEVTSPSSIASAVDTVKRANNGRLDYLVNNAGLFHVIPVLDTDIENAKGVFEVNFWGMLAVTQAFAPLVIAAKGCIVNIGSVSGTMHSPYLGMFHSFASSDSTKSRDIKSVLTAVFPLRHLRCDQICLAYTQ